MKPRVLVLRAAGTNCDGETAHAFTLAGGEPTVLHVNRLREKPEKSRFKIRLSARCGRHHGKVAVQTAPGASGGTADAADLKSATLCGFDSHLA